MAGRLVGQLLHVGEPRVVVDRDVHPVPAEAAVVVPSLASVDPVAAAGSDPPQHLGVEVDELARALALVADDGWPGLEPVEAAQAPPAQEGVDRRAGEARLPGEDVRAGMELEAPGADRLDERGRVGAGLAVDGARPVDGGPARPRAGSATATWSRSGG